MNERYIDIAENLYMIRFIREIQIKYSLIQLCGSNITRYGCVKYKSKQAIIICYVFSVSVSAMCGNQNMNKVVARFVPT